MTNYLAQRTGLIGRIHFVQQEIAEEQGAFTLFALLERENWAGKWDIVVSAAWMGEGIKSVLNLVFDKLKKYLTKDEMLTISQVIVLKPAEPFVKEVLTFMQAENPTNPLFYEFKD